MAGIHAEHARAILRHHQEDGPTGTTGEGDRQNRQKAGTKTGTEEVSTITGHRHPYVSEAHEGRPWFEWCVAVCVVVSALLALLDQILAATLVLAGTAFISATVRLVMRHKSPWKVRTIAFDCIIGYGLAFGLPLTLLTIDLITR